MLRTENETFSPESLDRFDVDEIAIPPAPSTDAYSSMADWNEMLTIVAQFERDPRGANTEPPPTQH